LIKNIKTLLKGDQVMAG